MSRTETTTRTIFKFDELSDEAKAKARDWYRTLGDGDEWWDHIYEDAAQMGELIGIEVGTAKGRRGKAIFFSGFWSQGDGACFEGTYTYKKGGLKALKSEAPARHQYGKPDGSSEWIDNQGNAALHRIAKALQDSQAPHFYQLAARVKQSGRYSHSGCMDVEVWHDEYRYRDIGDAEEEIRQLLRDFADWIYVCLEAEYDWLNSDEVVGESILANEHEFTECGIAA
jgi:hypothetical protein